MTQIHDFNSILDKSSKYVTDLFEKELPRWAVYHNLDHTIDTVNGCLEIGKGMNLNVEEMEILCIAAWFHDTGYIYVVEGHEEISADMASKFLKAAGFPGNRISEVSNCILATKISNLPETVMESVLRDSDLISLGKSDFIVKNDLLKLEIELRENIKIDDVKWLRRSIKFLSSHNFLSEYAKHNFSSQLRDNLRVLRNMLDKINR